LKKFVSPLARFALPYTKFIPGVGPGIYAGGTLAQRAGLFGTGQQMTQAPDGQLYEYVEGVDGLGNPVGFWRGLRRAAAGLVSRIPGISSLKRYTGPFCQGLPQLATCVQQVPAAMPVYRGARQVCNTLKRFGLAGSNGLMEAPDGQMYEVIEGIGESGERRRSLRRVRLIIPAYIGPGRRRRAVIRGTPAASAAAC
jgi:hypothetical protein